MPTQLAQVAPMADSPWGGLLAVYFAMIGVPSGLTLAVWWHRQRCPTAALTLDWRAGWASLGLLAAAGALLTIDLGRPERFTLMLTEFGNWDSPISLGAKIIALKVFLLGVALYMLSRRRAASAGAAAPLPARGATRQLERAVTWLLVASSIALAIYPVAVLARTWVSPLAGTSGSALLFLVTSLLTGYAVVELIATGIEPRGNQDAGRRSMMLLLLMTFGAAMVFTAVSEPVGPARESLDAVLRGDWMLLFYGGVLGIGLAVPVLVLLLARRRRVARMLGAVAVLVGSCLARFLVFTA
ncbi:NrfD/PsrC family molybdoenzyme membrane anchor subunit [Streptomyces sp. BB1-1-1]|uniref:NrfD/PsrC family molybdoenzyme membrane anchor subunit n=1 Tax=Streptomyces sp. BB1-1-1 TaxID=3074430 RepID=UPI002877527E|nr:NrfD/PsrC family molybdoenzyme membrane anchor subunit [Streptomyces sp. BB1-1-1]WND33490.1 NrfD/PsrC family molybdoenzyme membrane anchor subunit [Streptomyces sp. BB1-1-1]